MGFSHLNTFPKYKLYDFLFKLFFFVAQQVCVAVELPLDLQHQWVPASKLDVERIRYVSSMSAIWGLPEIVNHVCSNDVHHWKTLRAASNSGYCSRQYLA